MLDVFTIDKMLAMITNPDREWSNLTHSYIKVYLRHMHYWDQLQALARHDVQMVRTAAKKVLEFLPYDQGSSSNSSPLYPVHTTS